MRSISKKTPTTYKGLHKFDYMTPADAALSAWTDPGNFPALHRQRQEDLRDTMPLLARALDRMTGEKGHQKSDMNGNPYAEHSAVSDREGESDGHWGIAQTTLALAYEQRTANLIAAYETMIPKHYGEPIPKEQRPIILRIRDEINERLGLSVDKK